MSAGDDLLARSQKERERVSARDVAWLGDLFHQKANFVQATVKPEEIAEVIAFALSRPRRLVANEILLRPADQAL